MKRSYLVLIAVVAACTQFAQAADLIRYPLPNKSTFPIAQAVEVPGDGTVVYMSGVTPAPADPKAAVNTVDYWGNTRAQTLSVFSRMDVAMKALGLGYGDIIKMTVFLVGDPALAGRMDFTGFMEGYSQFFGTATQPNLPARSTVQVAGLVSPGMLVEIEVTLVRPPVASSKP